MAASCPTTDPPASIAARLIPVPAGIAAPPFAQARRFDEVLR
jgi:hypothetical protein